MYRLNPLPAYPRAPRPLRIARAALLALALILSALSVGAAPLLFIRQRVLAAIWLVLVMATCGLWLLLAALESLMARLARRQAREDALRWAAEARARIADAQRRVTKPLPPPTYRPLDFLIEFGLPSSGYTQWRSEPTEPTYDAQAWYNLILRILTVRQRIQAKSRGWYGYIPRQVYADLAKVLRADERLRYIRLPAPAARGDGSIYIGVWQVLDLPPDSPLRAWSDRPLSAQR